MSKLNAVTKFRTSRAERVGQKKRTSTGARRKTRGVGGAEGVEKGRDLGHCGPYPATTAEHLRQSTGSRKRMACKGCVGLEEGRESLVKGY